ncbi:hypothetical protein RFI_38943 [Reticulomyxa filosa]|uniref:Uncharacterized protein n=1 Tax=Reticulomyxa filosa TaxID=46433 RepID=X6LAI6_RETFI|nr:hypothetical protein RFI_38943 [Reticulomyxa filosa]|eukprot:ETN98548.1 hypothetical protein RFI_38943 [Reticulomyxa filosa]
MSSVEALVTIGAREDKISLICSTLETLKRQIIETSKETEQGKELTKITDCNGSEIETDQHFQNVVQRLHPLHLYAYFQPNKQTTSQKKERQSYQVKCPLVLLAGAMKYEQRPYLECIKQDLDLFQNLFENKFGYRLFSTYNSQHPNTESLTLNDLNNFILERRLDLLRDSDEQPYDALIFVWCGYTKFKGNTNALLITSDNKTKDFQDIQNELVMHADYFAEKPKIFINISYGEEEENGVCNIWHNQNVHIFTVVATIPSIRPSFDNSEHRIEKKESISTEIFCRVFQSNVNQSLQFVIEHVNEIVQGQTLSKKMICSDVYLIPRLRGNHDINITTEILDFKKHWNKYWRKSNAEAMKIVMQMINSNEQGLIIVANYTNAWQMAIGKSSIRLDDNTLSLRRLIHSNNTKKKQFEDYCLYVITSRAVILSDIEIDGNVYSVNCEIQCKGKNVKITTQLFVTKDTLVDQQVMQSISPIRWDTTIHFDIFVTIQDLENKADQFLAMRSFDEAIDYSEQALQLSIRKLGINHPYVAIIYNTLGVVCRNDRQHDKAIEYYEKALDIFVSIFGSTHLHIGTTHYNLGQSYFYKGQYDKAVECYEYSLKIRKGIFKMNDRYIADACWNLGSTLKKKGEPKNAGKCYEEAWKIYSAIFGEWNKETLQAKINVKEFV